MSTSPPDYLLDADIQAQGIESMTHEIKRLRAENTRLLKCGAHETSDARDTLIAELTKWAADWAVYRGPAEKPVDKGWRLAAEEVRDIITKSANTLKASEPPTVPTSCLANVIKHNDAAIDLVIERGTRIAELEAEVLRLSETLPYCPHCDCDYCGAVKGRLER